MGKQDFQQRLRGGGKRMVTQRDHTDASFDGRLDQFHATRAQLLHLVDAQRRYRADAQAAGYHAADGRQLMALECHRELAVARRDVLLQQQAYRRRPLQGDEILGQDATA